jgi:micrococcal nuclease
MTLGRVVVTSLLVSGLVSTLAAAQDAGGVQAAILDSSPTGPIRPGAPCHVDRIVDGDTMECADMGRVRLIGIDAPELSQSPFGAEAAATLAAFVPLGEWVLLESDVEARDQYGRLLAYVWYDGGMVNWRMIRAGEAVLLTHPPNVQYAAAFADAEHRAREQKRGLWATGGFDCRPSDRRGNRCD